MLSILSPVFLAGASRELAVAARKPPTLDSSPEARTSPAPRDGKAALTLDPVGDGAAADLWQLGKLDASGRRTRAARPTFVNSPALVLPLQL